MIWIEKTKHFIKANGLKHGDQINKLDINLLASIAKFRDAEVAVKDKIVKFGINQSKDIPWMSQEIRYF